MNKILSMFGALALLGLTAGQATASTVSVIPGSTTISADTATSVSVAIAGNFTETTLGGTFLISWDASLSLTSFVVDTPPTGTTWTFGLGTPGTNNLFIDIGTFSGVIGTANIANLTFNALLPAGGSAIISMADATSGIQTGWIDLNGAPIAVDYVGGTITAPVPVPAAAWLMLSGLLGLVGVARRKHA